MRERKATLGIAPILPGLVLVLIIVWALAAVLMLTGTLVNAREIDDTIPLIQNQVSPIDKNLDNVKRAAETNRIAGRIRTRAQPLVGRTDRIITAASSIDRRAKSIMGTARSINETAKTINGNVTSINDTVGSINRNVTTIGDTVGSINTSVLAIGGTVGSINRNVTSINARASSILRRVGPRNADDRNSINASVNRIQATFTDLGPETRSIDTGVAAINGRASRGISGVGLIKIDFAPISALVGIGNPAGHDTRGPGTIHGHANSIDCSRLINLLGRTEYCDR